MEKNLYYILSFIIIFILSFSIKHIWSRLALYILNDLTFVLSKFFLRIYLIYLLYLMEVANIYSCDRFSYFKTSIT